MIYVLKELSHQWLL